MNKYEKLYKAQEILDEIWDEATDLSDEQQDKLADIITSLRNFPKEIAKKHA